MVVTCELYEGTLKFDLMKLVVLLLFLLNFLLFSSCESNIDIPSEEDSPNLEYIGTWYEMEDTNSIWSFSDDEVKWNNFHHFYSVTDSSFIISGLQFNIIDYSKNGDSLKLKGRENNLITLIRR